MPVQRLSNSALSGVERKFLYWIARRLPARLSPDHLTAIGLIGALAAAGGYLGSRSSLQWLWLASLGLALHWFGDSLDGTVARLRSIERPRYGFFVDHTTDLFCQALIFLTLGLSPCVHFGIACLGLIAFLMAFVFSLICVEVRRTLRLSYFGIGPTEIRALLICGNVLTVWWGVIDLSPWLRRLAPGLVSGPVTLHEGVIVLLFAFTLPTLAMLAMRERSQLDHEDPRARALTLTEPVVPRRGGAAG